MTDATGTVVWAADYLPFGQADVTISSVENNLRFSGQYYDNETGLHYNYWRYYDPSLGRYLRADPSHSKQPDGYAIPFLLLKLIDTPEKLNDYSYCSNKPTMSVDLFGLIDTVTETWKKCGYLRTAKDRCNCRCQVATDFDSCVEKCMDCFSSKNLSANELCMCSCKALGEDVNCECVCKRVK